MWLPTPPPNLKFKQQIFKDLQKTAKFIYQIGELEALRKPSIEVSLEKITTREYITKFEYLKKCLTDYRLLTGKGRGIAAVQVGIPERFFMMYVADVKEKYQLFINPVITNKSSDDYLFPESCMSCNGLIVKAKRPEWVEFDYLTQEGEKKHWVLRKTTKKSKLYNRVIQHEIDHLNGIINIDLVSSKELIFESDEKYYQKADFEKI